MQDNMKTIQELKKELFEEILPMLNKIVKYDSEIKIRGFTLSIILCRMSGYDSYYVDLPNSGSCWQDIEGAASTISNYVVNAKLPELYTNLLIKYNKLNKELI